jgi:hypothetical protein
MGGTGSSVILHTDTEKLTKVSDTGPPHCAIAVKSFLFSTLESSHYLEFSYLFPFSTVLYHPMLLFWPDIGQLGKLGLRNCACNLLVSRVIGGAEGDRTPDLRIANAALCQTELLPHAECHIRKHGSVVSRRA